jgi:5-dehydro-2-deoxygluconokinase
MSERYDIVCMGRSSIDLYSNDSGAPFVDIESFGAFVGGCPTNIAVGTRRLGLKSALLTAVGEDPVGDFVVNFLEREGVETRFIPRKPGRRTSAVVLGIEPPDRFPLVFYRENCADLGLTMDDVDQLPLEQATALLVSGTGLSDDPSRTATYYAAERAHALGANVVLDVDFRADQWPDARAYGVAVRRLLPLVELAIGTEEELIAAALDDALVRVPDSQVSSPEVTGDLLRAIDVFLTHGVDAVVVKRGADGATVYDGNASPHTAPPFPVEVENVLGAGDAFASGFLYAWMEGLDWEECVAFGNACGAIVVTRQGCANFMPTLDEVRELMESAEETR